MGGIRRLVVVSMQFTLCAAVSAIAAEGGDAQTKPEAAAKTTEEPALEIVESDLKRLSEEYDVWVDMKRKWVVLGGQVSLREGLLEMFACPRGTKEHESVVSVNCTAQFAHTALLAVGAKTGNPVRYSPEYETAQGAVVEIEVVWKDEQGRTKHVPAQQWVRNIRTRKAMEYSWVFGGSHLWKDEATGREFYSGDAGDFICVSNFPSATLDLPVKSPQDNSQLLYEAFTDNIPELGTKLRLVLRPQLEKKSKP